MKYAIENGIIDLSYVQKNVEVNKRKEFLDKHPYKIWEGKDGRYYTYIPENEGGRTLRSRKTRRDIEDVIAEYWKEVAQNPTICDIYEEWIQDKVEREEITITTKNRYDRQYRESMTEFGEMRIKSIDEYDIEKFVLNAIHRNNMTAKGFSNLRTILFGIFRTAKKRKMISFSITEVMSDIDISKKLFRKVKKEDDELVFMDDEIRRLFSYMKTRRLDLKDLGILLLFYTGMRPGELSALEWSDFSGNILSIKKTEIRYEGIGGKYIYEIRNFPKTEAGIRDIVIPENAMWIVSKIKDINPNGKYVFEIKGKRIRSCLFDDRLRAMCRNSGIREKSLNKIRKTYATILLDSGVDESLIISQMGHTDIQTTKAFYYKNRKRIEQKSEVIDAVFKKNLPVYFD